MPLLDVADLMRIRDRFVYAQYGWRDDLFLACTLLFPIAIAITILLLLVSCAAAKPPAVLDWSKPEHQPAWTYPEDWELRNHDRIPKLGIA